MSTRAIIARVSRLLCVAFAATAIAGCMAETGDTEEEDLTAAPEVAAEQVEPTAAAQAELAAAAEPRAVEVEATRAAPPEASAEARGPRDRAIPQKLHLVNSIFLDDPPPQPWKPPSE
jgi:hypothetical protein